MVGRGRRKFAILVAVESLICDSLVPFQHHAQQPERNLTNLNYEYGIFQ